MVQQMYYRKSTIRFTSPYLVDCLVYLTWWSRFACVKTAPFGFPVVPEVYTRVAFIDRSIAGASAPNVPPLSRHSEKVTT